MILVLIIKFEKRVKDDKIRISVGVLFSVPTVASEVDKKVAAEQDNIRQRVVRDCCGTGGGGAKHSEEDPCAAQHEEAEEQPEAEPGLPLQDSQGRVAQPPDTHRPVPDHRLPDQHETLLPEPETNYIKLPELLQLLLKRL